MKYRTTEKSLKEIGAELGVEYILEGTVRWSKTGDQSKVRITPQLNRVSDDRNLWAENYERALMEVFTVQADIAKKIVEQLGLTLLESDRQNLANIPTENPEAYQHYLKALQKIRRRSDHSGSMAAQPVLDSAVALDPSFALAHALRSEAYSHFAYNSPGSENGKIALESAERSLELQPGLPQGHFALGNYYYSVDVDYDRAIEEFSIAKSELYNDPELLAAISSVQIEQGLFEEALENQRKAVELDPLNARRHSALASVLRSHRRFDEAEQTINRAIALEPDIQHYYEDKIEGLISQYGDIERIKPVISEALKHCDTTEFIIKNSWITRYIPDLQTDSIIANYIQKQTADTSEHYIFHGHQIIFYSHLDILEDYDDEARKLAERWGGFVGSKGLLFSFFGECDQAVKFGLRDKEMISIDERYLRELWRIMIVARIYANCGKYDEAINELELVLSLETDITVNTLKYKHWIDPFRDHPRYQALIKKYALQDAS
jgi:tetratricopeptide (TPR) repeat protein